MSREGGAARGGERAGRAFARRPGPRHAPRPLGEEVRLRAASARALVSMWSGDLAERTAANRELREACEARDRAVREWQRAGGGRA